MAVTISRDNVFFAFSPRLNAIARIDLLDIQVDQRSRKVTIPGEGALGDVITQMETSISENGGGLVGLQG